MLENSNTELKREYTPDIKKEVIAFANSGGGTVYIGRDDNGNPYPIHDVDETMTQISNTIRDSILPDVTMFIGYENTTDSVTVTVQEGTNKPYYLKDKGIKPSGVYVRQGSSSVPASFEQIREMIKLTDGDKLESARSLNQELTFDASAKEFERLNIKFNKEQMRTLGIIGADGLYTNLGLLLSDQCTHNIKFAIFDGTKKGTFRTRKEVGGSIIEQLYGAFDFLALANKLPATFSGLYRIEQYDYPIEAIREAMLNAIVHRDYSLSGSIIVSIYDDRMEFVSLGGLVPGLHLDDLFIGVSQPRNDKLANIFYRLKHIEAYGTGLKRIMQHYEDFDVKPEITATAGAFVLTLPNMNYIRPFGIKTPQSPQPQPKSQHKKVLDYLQDNEFITNEVVQELLTVKQTRAYAVIREMVGEGLIVKSDFNGEYVLER